jgi:hypothetical protein
MEACKRWQNIAIWWCIAILCLIFDDFEALTGHNTYLVIKVCLIVAFSLYIFVIFTFGFIVDTISIRYENSMVQAWRPIQQAHDELNKTTSL